MTALVMSATVDWKIPMGFLMVTIFLQIFTLPNQIFAMSFLVITIHHL
jgi:hypothetical protein